MSASGHSYLNFALRYAFRNLWRNSRRTSLTISTVLFSVGVAIVANRYSSAIMQLWEDGAVATGTAHAQLHAKGYWQKQEGVQKDLTLADANPFEEMVREDSFVEGYSRRLVLEGIISTGDNNIYFIGKGIEGGRELSVSPWIFMDKDEGQFVDSSKFPNGITVGKGLAQSLKLKLGDEVTLITQTVQGSVNGIDAKIIGIVDKPIPSFSQRVVYAPIELLQKLIRMPGRYTELAIKLQPGVDAERWVKVKRSLATGTSSELRGWWEIDPIIRNVGLIWDSVVVVITLLLFLSTSLSMLNIIFMMVAERTVEIGTLMAIGARPSDVRFLFALEAILIGIIGGALGAALGNIVVYVMDVIGVPFSNPFGNGNLVIHPKVHLLVSCGIFALGVLICYLSALMPARKAALVEPVRAFRGQIT